MQKLAYVLSLALCLAVITVCYGKSSDELSSDLSRSSHYSNALSFRRDIENGRLEEKTKVAIDKIIIVANVELRKKGANLLADRMMHEYASLFTSRNIGDHEGIKWLLKIHDEIEFVLGETICRAIRMHDLWVLAHAIPVVFTCLDKVDALEYMLHFIPLTGVVSYWVTYGGCMGASLGTGFAFICGFAGMGVEQIVIRFVAPVLSTPVWKTVCKE